MAKEPTPEKPGISLERRKTPARIQRKQYDELRPSLVPLPKARFAARVGRVAGDLTMLATKYWPLADGGRWPLTAGGPPPAPEGSPVPVFREVEPLAWSLWAGVLFGDVHLPPEVAGPWTGDPDVVPTTRLGLLSAFASFVSAFAGALIERARHP